MSDNKAKIVSHTFKSKVYEKSSEIQNSHILLIEPLLHLRVDVRHEIVPGHGVNGVGVNASHQTNQPRPEHSCPGLELGAVFLHLGKVLLLHQFALDLGEGRVGHDHFLHGDRLFG